MNGQGVVLITGMAGQLGAELSRLLACHGIEHCGWDLPEVDLSDLALLEQRLRALQPCLALHAAAFTQVDACETAPAKAMAVNASATGKLASCCGLMGIPLVYLSTDFVFDGRKTEPYTTQDKPRPLSVYGRSKLAGERLVAKSGGGHWIVRTSWLYGARGENFPKAILRQASQGKTARVVADQVGSPTYAKDLAQALCRLTGLLPGERRRPYGLYHASNAGGCSWCEFAGAILAEAGWLEFAPALAPAPITSAALGRPARRPAYSVLDNSALELTGLGLRPWREALPEFLAELRAEQPDLFPH